MAKLYFKYGPMGSSKSAQLLMTAHSLERRDIPFLCIKPSIDNRDGEGVITSRIGISRECVTVLPTDDIYKLVVDYTEVSVGGYLDKPLKWILVDECQFLTEEQVDQLSDVVDRLGISVLCYGLRTDFTTRLFEGSRRLMEIADDIDELKMSCDCGGKAVFNARIDVEGYVITDGEQIAIGGDDMYRPLCRRCYNKSVKKY